MLNWFITTVSRSLNGERKVLLINGSGTAGYPRAKNEFGPLPLKHTQKSTQNEL